MNPQVFIKRVRNARNALAINLNSARGREFIPRHRTVLNIETSSLCNLDCCFCAYGKKQSPKLTMSNAMFFDSATQALDMGFTGFDLTPCTGDVFMDRHLWDKLDWLDQNPRVESYGFYTNFTVLDHDDVARLARLKKLQGYGISVYGHDLPTFLTITQSTEKVYQRLIRNLDALLEVMRGAPVRAYIALHAGQRSVRGRKSEVLDRLEALKAAGAEVAISKVLYNNWGGYITKDDLRGLPIQVGGPDLIYKKGACVRLFTTLQVMATGIVNGCACRDADATLQLGDLNKAPLRDIISVRNPAYIALIDEQQRGDFRPVCQSCDFYASIYHRSSGYDRQGVELQTLAEFKGGAG